MSYFVKVAGTGESPITAPDWFVVHRRWAKQNGHFSGFSRCPKVEPGDRFVMNFFGLGIARASTSPRTDPGIEVSVKPGLAHHAVWWGRFCGAVSWLSLIVVRRVDPLSLLLARTTTQRWAGYEVRT